MNPVETILGITKRITERITERITKGLQKGLQSNPFLERRHSLHSMLPEYSRNDILTSRFENINSGFRILATKNQLCLLSMSA